jgi:hypothetical protein
MGEACQLKKQNKNKVIELRNTLIKFWNKDKDIPVIDF